LIELVWKAILTPENTLNLLKNVKNPFLSVEEIQEEDEDY